VVTTKQLVYSAATYKELNPNLYHRHEIGFLELGAMAFSDWAMYVISFTLFCSQYIAVCTYLVFLHATLTPLLATVFWPSGAPAGFGGVVLVGSVVVELVLALAPDPSFMERMSNFGNGAFFASVIFLVVHGLIYSPPDPARNLVAFESLDGIFMCFGIASFTLSAHAECLSIFSTADSVTQAAYPATVERVTWFASAIYLFLAIFGYACFGAGTQQIIFANYTEPESTLGLLLQLSICLMIFCNFPLTLFPVHQMIEQQFGLGLPSGRKCRLSVHQVASRFALIIFAGVIAYGAGSKFGDISTIGGAFVGLVAFVLPPLIYTSLHGGWAAQSWFELSVNLAILSLGLFGSLSSLAEGIHDIAAPIAHVGPASEAAP